MEAAAAHLAVVGSADRDTDRSVGASREGLYVLGGQRVPADRPIAAMHLFQHAPGHPAHVLTLDRHHRIGEFLYDLPTLRARENALNHLHIDKWHPVCPFRFFLRCAGLRLLLSTGLVTFTLVKLLSRYIRTITDSSKLNTGQPTRSAVQCTCHAPAVASSGQSRARMTARQHNVSAAHGAGIPTDLPSWFGPRMTASLRTWLSPSCG